MSVTKNWDLRNLEYISCTAVNLLQYNFACDNLMVLAIKRIHNLPPHLSYVSTLLDITQKPKHGIDELKQRLIDNWDRIPQCIIKEAIDQRQTCLRACVKAKERHFKHLLWSSHTTGLQSLQTPKPVILEPLTLLRGRQHNSSVLTKVRWQIMYAFNS